MANYISKMKLGGTAYSLKDNEARAAISALETAVASSLVFKGVVSSAAEITGLTNYKRGWTYKVSESFSIDGLGMVENGDMIVCINSNTSYSTSDWNIVQNNVDTMEGADGINAGTRGLVPAPTAADNNKYLRGDGSWSSPELVWGSF